MKTSLTLLAIALAAVPLCGTAAAPLTPKPSAPPPPPAQSPSATKTTVKNIQIPNPQPNPKESGKIERAGTTSSQPWTKIVGWHPGTSQFATAENHESQLTLASFKF
jgi:hypothetical protein